MVCNHLEPCRTSKGYLISYICWWFPGNYTIFQGLSIVIPNSCLIAWKIPNNGWFTGKTIPVQKKNSQSRRRDQPKSQLGFPTTIRRRGPTCWNCCFPAEIWSVFLSGNPLVVCWCFLGRLKLGFSNKWNLDAGDAGDDCRWILW